MAEIRLALRIDSLRLPLRQSLEMAARLNIRHVELNARIGINPSSLSDTGLRSFRKMLDDLNLRVAALRFPTRRGYDHLQDLDRRVEATKATMMLAYRLGAPVVINNLGNVPESVEDPRYDLLKSVVDDLGRHGARVGSFFAAETGSEHGTRLNELLETTDDGFVGVALNPGQLVVNQIPLAESVAAIASRVQIVSAVDGVVDLAAGRGIAVPLGQGIVDFPEIMGVLEEHHFAGPFVVGRSESTLDELRDGLNYLGEL